MYHKAREMKNKKLVGKKNTRVGLAGSKKVEEQRLTEVSVAHMSGMTFAIPFSHTFVLLMYMV